MKARYDKLKINKAKKLRAAGLTYSEITKKLKIKVPKSTISNWCSGIYLPAEYQEKIDKLNKSNLSKAQKIAMVSCKLKREKLFSSLHDKNKHLAKKLKDRDLLKMLLSILYLGEGSKWHSHKGLSLGSSSPEIITLYLQLLHLCYNIKPKDLKCRISYRADQNINKLEIYWSRITLIPLKNFYKTIPDPRTVGKPTKQKKYKGVCVVMTGRTDIQLELELIPKIILEGL